MTADLRRMLRGSPLHRLHASYARVGADIPVSTLSDWVGNVADVLEPIATRLEQRVLAAHVVRTDATGLKVLDPHSPKNRAWHDLGLPR